MQTDIFQKSKKIKILLTDIDGVLTDGGMYYTDKGDIMKKFHARDGMAITLLRNKNIPTIIITKEKTPMVKQWAKKMHIEKAYNGIIKKELLLEKICKIYHVTPKEIAFIGDDVNDLNLLKKVGFSVTPKDGIETIKKISDYTCKAKGGEGVLREVADIILNSKQNKPK